ncbi:hypothetical protein IFM89_008074 [Coptis chinensis]|uniref:TPX2 C-terminal domain-containing protein n=1 Tax=Coptis chinensis TaxID=261450 RepID=A0A835IU40_9MAGN|nr:hypothetical protein IFM89_008074 [Coptis chinensis]
MTPVKESQAKRSQMGENTNPNLANATPKKKSGSSPMNKTPKSKKSVSKIRERKFIVAKKKQPRVEDSGLNGAGATCKCKNKVEGVNKCPCIAYQNLRASQEDFFKNRTSLDHEKNADESENCEIAENQEEGRNGDNKNVETLDVVDYNDGYTEEYEVPQETGSSTIEKRREKMLEEARRSIPEEGDGRVKYLVQAFERLRTIPSKKESMEKDDEEEEENINKKGLKWGLPLPGMQPPKITDSRDSLSSFSPSQLFFTSDNFGMDSRVSSSLDSSRTSGGGRRSRRNSSDSTGTFGGRKWKKMQLRVTRQQPFKLRTEQRGRSKEEEFLKKVKEMSMEEEKLRIPIAQGLPWTTDEPECLLKPPVKEITRPLDLKLHSDMRAVERAEFDHYVTEKLSLIEQYKLERERQQKLAEEEEIRRLRKELVPRAQPMPYFDRPFVPQRSVKHPTVPKQPKFHMPQHKKIRCMSWNDISIYTDQH